VQQGNLLVRREQYVSRLSEHAQVSRELAGDIMDELKPTGVRVKPSVQESTQASSAP
jgi:hypothetical protein